MKRPAPTPSSLHPLEPGLMSAQTTHRRKGEGQDAPGAPHPRGATHGAHPRWIEKSVTRFTPRGPGLKRCWDRERTCRVPFLPPENLPHYRRRCRHIAQDWSHPGAAESYGLERSSLPCDASHAVFPSYFSLLFSLLSGDPATCFVFKYRGFALGLGPCERRRVDTFLSSSRGIVSALR